MKTTITTAILKRFGTRPLWETATDLHRDADMLRVRRYGMIEVVAGQLTRIVLRPYPKLVSLPEIWWLGGRANTHSSGDRCRVFYDQPLSCPNFLALKYIVSTRQASFASLSRAQQVLDSIACIKQSDAIVCEGSNLRLSDRLAARWGWERHCLPSSQRHFIKRFYGNYPRWAMLADTDLEAS